MKSQFLKIIDFIKNMGFRYILFRIVHRVKAKLGWQRQFFPVNPPLKNYITSEDWKKNTPPFFFYGKNIHGLPKHKPKRLKDTFTALQKGEYTFFSKLKFNIGTSYDWVTNPSTGYRYDSQKHWSQIEDFSKVAGDIKLVWEKARFSFLYDIIRYDYHFEQDQAAFVFQEIEDFIDKNPINQGPNYKCSQEISLRILNWTFALYYYKDAKALTTTLFDKIMNAIYWQLHHVYQNIHFSRIAVRNNHAITETLMLYLSNLLFPFIPETKKWSIKGKKWFEKEIAYQIYQDGTFLQFSMNYHRVVVQLLTWGIQLAKLNGDTFDAVVYDSATKSLQFLEASMDIISGKLPNYGANDGALFFKLTEEDYRVYRSQLEDLRSVIKGYTYKNPESLFWYGCEATNKIKKYPALSTLNKFEKGGYYIIQEEDTKTFLRCGSYKDRPSQSDNLHLDIWVNGVNVLRDSGSYKYNTKKETLDYFNGCEGHNTVSVSRENQMLKGSRFIWYYWVKKAKARLESKKNRFEFNGTIQAFRQVGKNIKHHRKVIKYKSQNSWEVVDIVENKGDKMLYQYWHINPDYIDKIEIQTKDDKGKVLEPLVEKKWFSNYYGIKEKSIRLTFATRENTFNTNIKIKL